MHRHNLDEIAELAQGILADDTRARELIDTCEVCAAEYKTQTLMISALADTPRVAMTEHEKASLHRDLWTELRSPARAASRQRLGWRSWAFGTAATVLVLVGAIGVFSNMSSNDSAGETFNEIGSSLDSAAADTTLSSSRLDETEGVDSQSEEDLSPTDGGALSYAGTPFAEIAAAVRDEAALEFHEASSDAGKCIFAAGLTTHKAVLGFEEATDLVLAIPDGAKSETTEVSFVDPEACSLVHVED